MAIEYEDLDEVREEDQDEDRGDYVEDEELEDQDDSEDDASLEDDDESGDVDEEEDEEELEEVEETKPQNKIKIPKSRLDEVIRQREEAKERNAWLEEQLEKLINANLNKVEQAKAEEQKAPVYDFDAAEEKYITLILEGETAQASKLRREIDVAKSAEYKQMIDSLADTMSKQVKTENDTVVEEGRFNTLIENFENKYKFLDYEAEEYNEEAVDTVNTLLAGYVAAGKSKSEALRLAVTKVAPLYIKTVDKKQVQSLGNQRKVEAGKKAAKAAKAQPARTKSVSTRQVDSDATDVKRMSDRDFSKLTAKEKSVLRGDSF